MQSSSRDHSHITTLDKGSVNEDTRCRKRVGWGISRQCSPAFCQNQCRENWLAMGGDLDRPIPQRLQRFPAQCMSRPPRKHAEMTLPPQGPLCRGAFWSRVEGEVVAGRQPLIFWPAVAPRFGDGLSGGAKVSFAPRLVRSPQSHHFQYHWAALWTLDHSSEVMLELRLERVRLEWQSWACSQEALPTMQGSADSSQCEAKLTALRKHREFFTELNLFSGGDCLFF